MTDQPNPTMVPWLKPLRRDQESDLVREGVSLGVPLYYCAPILRALVQNESYSLLARLWKRVNTNKPPPPLRAIFTKCSTLWPCSKDKVCHGSVDQNHTTY